jgi:lipopolysaccharide biosynthesis protein
MEHLNIIEELIVQFEEQRKAILEMITQLESIKKKIDILIPDTLDKRYLRFFEEKVKTITNLFTTLLEMRKEISKNLKEEIEIRRKIVMKESDFDFESTIDIRKIADKIEDFKKKRADIKDKLDKSIEKSMTKKDIEIPGYNAPLNK